MAHGADYLEYRRYRAPREDRTALIEPAWDRAAELVAANRRCRQRCRYDFHGRSLVQLSSHAREELVAEAIRWTTAYRDVSVPAWEPDRLVYLAGHQPQLFHPGVWFKNFALGRLACQHGAVPINLVVDSDTVKSASIRVPGGSIGQPRLAMVPLDASGPVIPFEERQILNQEMFAGFGRRAAEQIAPLVPDPLVRESWPLAIHRALATENLGQSLAQSRHQLEGHWGFQTLELPQSVVCQLPAFAWFSIHLLSQAMQWLRVYNEAVGEYRRIHKIRSTAHPVPDLAVDGPWLEVPYWVWTAEDPRRRRLFVRQARSRLIVSDRQGVEIDLPMPDGDLGPAVEQWLDLPRRRIRIRSRALVTTLWARLVLGDLFLHGIGGAKYDQVTDALIDRFFGLRPPALLVLSATIQLPIPRVRVESRDLRAIDQRLRELAWHPEAAILAGGEVSEAAQRLIAAKRRWIAAAPADNVRSRHREIRRINAELQPWVAEERQRLGERRPGVQAALRAEAILASREYGYCLYPENALREFLLGQLPGGGSCTSGTDVIQRHSSPQA